MARFIQVEQPVQHNGLERVLRGVEALGSFSATPAVLHVLAFIGSPVTRAAGKVRAGVAALAAARRQRIEDDRLWKAAMDDARVMADLSRAMSQEALRHPRYF